MVIKFDKEIVNLDLACGNNKAEGFIGIDKWKTDATDYEFDLLEFPWPIEDNAVDNIQTSHFFEHIPAHIRSKFMDECYRILKPTGKLHIICPYYTSARATQDFTHQWPPISEHSFLYFNKNWREQNKLTHGLYEMTCDFNYTYGFSLDELTATRNQEYQAFAAKHFVNAAYDIFVTLTPVK